MQVSSTFVVEVLSTYVVNGRVDAEGAARRAQLSYPSLAEILSDPLTLTFHRLAQRSLSSLALKNTTIALQSLNLLPKACSDLSLSFFSASHQKGRRTLPA